MSVAHPSGDPTEPFVPLHHSYCWRYGPLLPRGLTPPSGQEPTAVTDGNRYDALMDVLGGSW